MTDATTVTAEPAIPVAVQETIENDANAVITAAKVIAPSEVAKAAAWYSRYAKGIVATVGGLATAALITFPPTGPIYKYADFAAIVVTIIGVIAKANADKVAK
jgi:hypothetical protein